MLHSRMSISFCNKNKKSAMADAKQGKAPEDFCNGSGQSRVVLAKPRLGGFGASGFASSSSSNSTSNPFGSVLRPSQLKPTVNPFFKVNEKASADESKKEQSTEDRLKDSEVPEVPKFVPLGSTSTRTNPVPVPTQPTSSTSSTSFVFGQNLSARVVMENVNNGEAKESPEVDHTATNGSELLFTSAAASVKENNQQEESSSTGESSSGSGLAAAAAEYERSHARPPPPAANYNITGEEGETNVLQISCRLFAWESGSWRERGRGVLRLNDGAGGARLVARAAGSLRLLLNTKLWSEMVADRAGAKSLRITAADQQNQIKLFLIMGAPQDITQLHRALSTRIASSKRAAPAAPCGDAASAHRAAERLEAADTEYHDKTDSQCPPKQTEEYESNVDGMKEKQDAKTLKRKEDGGEATSPKRPCPDSKE